MNILKVMHYGTAISAFLDAANVDDEHALTLFLFLGSKVSDRLTPEKKSSIIREVDARLASHKRDLGVLTPSEHTKLEELIKTGYIPGRGRFPEDN